MVKEVRTRTADVVAGLNEEIKNKEHLITTHSAPESKHLRHHSHRESFAVTGAADPRCVTGGLEAGVNGRTVGKRPLGFTTAVREK